MENIKDLFERQFDFMISLIEKTISSQIKNMRNDKGGTCVSVIIPLYHLSQDQKQDKAHIEKAINEVSENLIVNYSTEAPLILNKLTQLTRKIKFNRNDLGLGIYVSQNISLVQHFPFPV